MSKQLIEEIMELERHGEDVIAKATKEKEALIQHAHEEAHALVQKSEHTLDTERESAVKAALDRLQAEKQARSKASEQAARALEKKAQAKIDPAAKRVLERFTEYVNNEIS